MASGKKAGRNSQKANDFLKPYAPTIGTATDVGTNRAYNNGAVQVTFTADPRNPATSFTASGYCSVHNTTHSVTGASSPLTITGFGSGAVTTITVTATNSYGTSDASSASNSVTVTTVPATPAAPGVSSPSGTSYDSVTWSAPANGGKAITNYYVYSSDGKANNTASTSINVNQEAGTAQTYTVRADNANGSSVTSDASATVTTFSFVPFSVFGFSPFNVFGFSPFNVFGFSPFGVFGFSPTPPFGVFGFSPTPPFGVFGFSPTPPSFSVFGFSPSPGCIDQDTPIATVGPNGSVVLKPAKSILAGDEVFAATWDELVDESFGTPFDDPSATFTNASRVVTTISSVRASMRSTTVHYNNNLSKRFSLEEQILVKRDTHYQFVVSGQIVVGDKLIEMSGNTFVEVPVTAVDLINEERVVYTFDCEPTDTIVAGNIVCHNLKYF